MKTLLQRIFGIEKEEGEKSELPYGFFNYRLPGGRLIRAYNPPRAVITLYDEEGKPHERRVASPFGILFPAPAIFTLGGREVRLDPKQPLVIVDLPRVSGPIVNFGDTHIADTEHGIWDGKVGYGD
jgi:hypothetical protein